MRWFLILPLIGQLVLCPALCGTCLTDACAEGHSDDLGIGDDLGIVDDSGLGDDSAPPHDDEGCGSCICRGALKPDNSRLNGIDSTPHGLGAISIEPSPVLAVHPRIAGPDLTATARSTPTSGRLALLQSYRC